MHKITESKGSIISIFHYYTQITPLENGDHTIWMDYRQKIPNFSQNHWGNVFYNVHFPLLHINQLENGDHTIWIDYKQQKIRYLHETTKSTGFIMSIFHHYTQITPLENGGHTNWTTLQAKIPNFSRNHWGNLFYNVHFPSLHTNHPLRKLGPYSLNGLKTTNSKIYTKSLSRKVL